MNTTADVPGSSAREFDVAIVGASLAGSVAATLLARQGASVALIEKRPDPAAYKTMCTHYIQASATPVLQRLGIAEQIEAAGGLRNGVESWTEWGWIRPDPAADETREYGYDIRREKLDPMVRELAAGTPGVELMLGHTAHELLRVNGRVSGVRIGDPHHGEQEISARVVVGADGRDSHIARMAGIRARVRPHGRYGYFAYYRDLPLVTGNNTQFWFLNPDVAYAFPQDDGLTLLAVFQTKDRAAWFKRDLEANFANCFDGLPDAPDLSRATRVSKILGKLDMTNSIRRAAGEAVAFVGDAAMAADPLWGVGCGFAIQSAEWLADAIGPTLAAHASDTEVDASLDRYRRVHRRKLAGHYLMTSDYSSGRPFNPMERLLFSSAAKDPATAEGFMRIGTRSIRPNDPEVLGLLARAVWAGLTKRAPTDRTAPGGRYEGGTTLPANVQRRRISVGGVEVPVTMSGPQDSTEAVVFVHGNPGSSRDWDDLLSRSGAFARSIAMDLPGFGRADKPKDFDYTVPGYARFLDGALSELGVERVHLVLHDFGGPWGLEWAIDNPERLASVVLVNTGALPDYKWHYLARIWRTPVLGELFQASATRSGLHTVLRHGNPRGLPRAFVDRMFDDSDAGTNRAVLRLYRATSDPAADSARWIEGLRDLDIPALVVWGAHDPYLPVSLAERQREMLPRAEVAILPESGHWPFADDPIGVARHVEPFLRRHAGVAVQPGARFERETRVTV